jgi:hypothetical protein
MILMMVRAGGEEERIAIVLNFLILNFKGTVTASLNENIRSFKII